MLSLFACLQFAGVGGIQAATHVQQASNSDITSKSYTSFSVTFTAATTSGNAIILGVTYGNTNPTITATDSQGNTYVQAIKRYDSGHRQGCAILYATNITGGASTKVTVKFSASVAYLGVGIHEYSGIAPTSALDAVSGQIGNGNALSSGPAATTATGDLIFGCGVEDATGHSDQFSAGSDFSQRVDLGNAAAYADEDQVQTSAGSIAATWTLTPASNWIAAMAAFKTSTGSGVTGPSVTSLTPNSGSVGTSVTIAGANFGPTQGTNTVTFNGTLAAPTSWNPTSIVATVPNGATSGGVVVTVGAQASNAVNFTVPSAAPSITSLSPTSGPVGTSVTITGTNFGPTRGASTVTFNSTPATPTSWSFTRIVASVPNGATTGAVVVTVAAQPSNAVNFTVTIVVPSITSLSPNSGYVGSSVTITGTNFGATRGASTVTFNGTPATPTSWSSTRIVAPVPNGATSGGVVVTVGAQASNAVNFTVTVAVPSITSLSPNSGPVGASVTITGTNFGPTRGASTVTFNSTPAMPTSWSSTRIVAPVPNGATTGNVAVTVSGQTSNSVSFSVLPITVLVSPTTINLASGQSAYVSASLQNDMLNQGVGWSLSSSGCSGSDCGTLSGNTSTSVVYTAPSSMPSPPTVTLTATSVADSAKNASSSITVHEPSPDAAAVPTFADNHVSGSSTQVNPAKTYVLQLPNGTQGGNCIIVAFQYSVAPGVTPTVSDDRGNVYSAPASNSDGNQVVNLSFATNVAAGTRTITLTFSGGTPDFVSGMASEFYNVAASNALDGSSANSGTGSSVTAGSFIPANSGDLIYQYAIQDSSQDPMISWTRGTAWTLLGADLLDATAAQYQVQGSAVPVNPTLTMAPAQNFNSVAIALRSASAGSAPPAGIRVIRKLHHSVNVTNNPLALQCPTSGNLIVAAWIGVPGDTVSGLTDSKGNAWNSTGPTANHGGSGDVQQFYAGNSTPDMDMTIRLSRGGSIGTSSTVIFYDITGADTSPFDTRVENSGNQTSAGGLSGVTITPSTANGIIITQIGVSTGTQLAVSPGNFDSTVMTPSPSSLNFLDQNNGWAHEYNPDLATRTFVWTPNGFAADTWASIAVAYKAATSGSPGN